MIVELFPTPPSPHLRISHVQKELFMTRATITNFTIEAVVLTHLTKVT